MRRFFRFLHKWLSIPIGIIITVICLSGALLVFQDELEVLSHSSLYKVKNVTTVIPFDVLVPQINKESGKEITSIRISSDPARTYVATMKTDMKTKYFIDQYSGTIVGSHPSENNVFKTIGELHTSLLLNNKTLGRRIVGICTLLFVVILVSGIILWIPRSTKRLSVNFKIVLRKGISRMMFSSHNVLGMYACIVLLICALTGMMWSFGWYRNSVLSFFKEEPKTASLQQNIKQPASVNKITGDGYKREKVMYYTHWQSVSDSVRNISPDYQYIQINNGSISVQLDSRSADRYTFDKNTGIILKSNLYKDKGSTVKVMGWINSLHMGNYWGIWSKIFTFIAALIGASLPVTGYYLFYIKERNKFERNKKQNG